jgi:hypothetical protein
MTSGPYNMTYSRINPYGLLNLDTEKRILLTLLSIKSISYFALDDSDAPIGPSRLRL